MRRIGGMRRDGDQGEERERMKGKEREEERRGKEREEG